MQKKQTHSNMHKKRYSPQIIWHCLSILLCTGQDVAALLHTALVNDTDDGEKQEENTSLLDMMEKNSVRMIKVYTSKQAGRKD